MTIIISLPNQKAHIYRGTSLITTTAVSTESGVIPPSPAFTAFWKTPPLLLQSLRRRTHAVDAAFDLDRDRAHAGVVPGYPASHGCVRLPYSFAPKLFSMTEVGEQVVVAHSMWSPKPITHPALFQPLPPPMPPELVTQENERAKPMRKSSIEVTPGKTFGNQVILR